MIRLSQLLQRDKAKGRGLWRNKRGNIALITAFMIIPLTVALGTAYDFTMAESRQDQINGMADIATLAGVTPTMMGQPYSTAQAYSLKIFTSQLATVPGVTYNLADIDMSGGGDTSAGATVNRVMIINYKAASTNFFAGLVNMPTFPLSGKSEATSNTAPNIDFYLLLDTSPSMEIAATSDGIATMISNTQDQSDSGSNPKDTWTGAAWARYWPYAGETTPMGNGCAFGCHQSNPGDLAPFADDTGNPIKCTAAGLYSDGKTPFKPWLTGDPLKPPYTFPTTGFDNYDLSRCTGVVLRIDLVNTAAQNLMTTAATTEATNLAKYRMALFETNNNANANALSLYTLQPLTADLNLAKTQAATVKALEMCSNNSYACGDSNGDMDTNLDGNLVTMNTVGNSGYIPVPGNGTNNAGDTPQEVLFIVTDGQNDYSSGGRIYPPIDLNGTRCTAIKNRGIRIAMLYTVYMPLEETWWQGQVEPYLGYSGANVPYIPATSTVTDKIATAANACASPGLYYQVSTDGDISAALNHLFQEAIATARLLH